MFRFFPFHFYYYVYYATNAAVYVQYNGKKTKNAKPTNNYSITAQRKDNIFGKVIP